VNLVGWKGGHVKMVCCCKKDALLSLSWDLRYFVNAAGGVTWSGCGNAALGRNDGGHSHSWQKVVMTPVPNDQNGGFAQV
jgi:hypothetical protein